MHKGFKKATMLNKNQKMFFLITLIWHCVERRMYVEVYEDRCAKISNLLNNMLSNRFLKVFLECRYQTRKFEECKNHLEKSLETLSRFCHQCRLRPNPSKTEVCMFHLGTHDANRKLTVQFDNTLITHVDNPKYLGMTLDWTFSYKLHLEKLEWRWTIVSTKF
jgi:hypothetical protein